MWIDHLVVSGTNLKDSCDYLEDSLEVQMEDGGQHHLFGTHNKLLGLHDGLYLECIAIDPSAKKPQHPRWFDLDHFSGRPRLTNWVCGCKDVDQKLGKMPKEMGRVVKVSRDQLSWKITVPESGILPFDNVFPALIEWNSMEKHPCKTLKRTNCSLKHLTICHPYADRIELLLGNCIDRRVSFKIKTYFGLFAELITGSGKRCMLECL